MGQLFEKCFISLIFGEMQNRKIPLYHQVVDFKNSSMFSRPYRKGSHVEVRLFRSDLLTNGSNIGKVLRKFLEQNPRSELAIDVTLSSQYGEKIGKYANEFTNLLVLLPRRVDRQRPLEGNVRVISIEEFSGPLWLNLPEQSRVKIREVLDKAFQAIRGGRQSDLSRDFNILAEKLWNKVKNTLKKAGSQGEYRQRVIREITAQLICGIFPVELGTIISNERARGENDHANQLEELGRNIAKILRYENEKNLEKFL
jgi:hypothetical protein